MSVDEYWQIVDEVHLASQGDMKTKCDLLRERLNELPAPEAASFTGHFSDSFCDAYTPEIWSAAWIINRGCGDDSFMDFRSTLISMGQRIFEAALADADSLADFDVLPGTSTYQGYMSALPEIKPGTVLPTHKKRPHKLAGISHHPWEMGARFPKLTAKFGHKDADYSNQKLRHEQEEKNREATGKMVQLFLDGKVVTPGGWIPPYPAAKQITQERFSIDLEEYIYWATVMRLEKLTVDELKSWPYLNAIKLQLDTASDKADSATAWYDSLKRRNLA